MTLHLRCYPGAVGQALPDLGSDNHAVSFAEVLNFIIYRENLDDADLEDKLEWMDGE